MHVLYLDRYHLGDPLFLTRLAQAVRQRSEGLVLVHGAAEAGERALEAEGTFPEWRGGVLAVETAAQRATVERAARTLNRQIAAALTEAGVPAFRADGASRGLLRVTGAGVEVGPAGWVGALAEQGAVPVVAALVPGEGGAAREVDPLRVAVALAGALGATAVVLSTARAVGEGDAPPLPEPDLAARLGAARVKVTGSGLATGLPGTVFPV